MNKKVLKVIRELEKIRDEEENPFWNVSTETGRFLYIMAKAVKARSVLEIGTSNGYSGLWLGAAVSENGGKLITIESFGLRYEMAEENFKKAGLEKNVKQIAGHAPEVFFEIKVEFDFAFFDATKSEHISYLEAIIPKLKTSGIIFVDNLFSHKEQLKPFIRYIEKSNCLDSFDIPIGTGLLLIIKGRT